jgi:RHS repeat-associated protein
MKIPDGPEILAATRYPDPLTGEPSATDRDVYTVNALGERLTYTDRAGTTHTYAYDVVGRRISDTITLLGTGVNGAVRRIETAYDALGNATSVTSFNAATGGSAVNQVVRAFTSFGQLISEWQSHTGLVSLATTPRVQYAYSQTAGAQTRLSQMTYPDGYALSFNATFNDLAAGRVTNISGARAGSGTSGVLEAFKYLGASTVAERSRPEVGITLTMATTTGVNGDGGDKYTGLDRFGRVVDQRWTNSAGADVDRYGYTYDEYGNRTGRSNALASAFSETYGYEGLNQLQTFTRGDAQSASLTQGWQFDALGNWTTVTINGTDQTRVFNAQNELLQVGAATLTYSATGNMTTDAQGRTLVYDAWNRLVSVSNASGTQVAAYQYDGMNRRIVEQVAATGVSSALVRDLFYSQAWQVLEERIRSSGGDIPATADTRYIWSPVYVDALVARDRNADANNSTGAGGLEERVYALQDANWNTTAIVAASGVSGFSTGAVISRFAYTPYGESQTLTAAWSVPAAGSSPATPWQHLFQGLKFSDVTGLAYVRARDYSATLGRFIEMDPIGFAAGDNNWYRFVANGPTGQVDPSGLESWIPGPTVGGVTHPWIPPGTYYPGHPNSVSTPAPNVVEASKEMRDVISAVMARKAKEACALGIGSHPIKASGRVIFTGPILGSFLSTGSWSMTGTATVRADGNHKKCNKYLLETTWEFSDKIDCNSYEELKNKGYFSPTSKWWENALGHLEGSAEKVGLNVFAIPVRYKWTETKSGCCSE